MFANTRDWLVPFVVAGDWQLLGWTGDIWQRHLRDEVFLHRGGFLLSGMRLYVFRGQD